MIRAHAVRWTPLFLAAGILLSCPKQPPIELSRHWLTADLSAAEKRWHGRLVMFGSPEALPLLGEGWSHSESNGDGVPFRWAVEKQASFTLEMREAGERLVWLDCAPFRYEGAPPQKIHLRVRGESANSPDSMHTVELRDGRDRYALPLELARGPNRFEMTFDYTASSDVDVQSAPGGDSRRLAVAFYSLELDSHETLSGQPGAFSVFRTADEGHDSHDATAPPPPGVWLPSEASLSIYRVISPAARLEVRLGADRPATLAAPTGAVLEIEVTSERSRLHERVEVSADDAGIATFTMDLGELSGQISRMRFSAEEQGLFLRAEMVAPRPPVSRERVAPEAASGGNILLILLDGANALRMSSYGHLRETTPSIDRLAERAVVFETAVSQAVYTIASVGSLMTGQYPERHQAISFADPLAKDAVTVPGLLTLGGMETVGILGNAVVQERLGLHKGYDRVIPVWDRPDYDGSGRSVLIAAQRWLEENRDKRFFANVHFREPHFPYAPPETHRDAFVELEHFPKGIREDSEIQRLNGVLAKQSDALTEQVGEIRGLYDANLLYVDQLVGELLDTIDSLGLRDKTTIVLTADHGEALAEHGFIGHNTQLYEESIRIPLMISAPGVEPRRIEDLVELMDLAPTLLDLAGPSEATDSIPRRMMQGRSLAPALAGEPIRPKLAFSRTVWSRTASRAPRYSVRDDSFKLIWNSRTGERELYDLGRDPNERNNLIGVVEHDLRLGYLQSELFTWLREQELLRSLGDDFSPDVTYTPHECALFETLGYLDFVPQCSAMQTRGR